MSFADRRAGSRHTGPAKQVLIEGGVNNLLLGTAPDIVPGYAAMLRAIPSDKKVILGGILPVDEAALRADWPPLVNNAKIANINAQLVALCASFSNCTSAKSVMAMDMTGKTVDGIHLKHSTYQEWAARIAETMAVGRLTKTAAAN